MLVQKYLSLPKQDGRSNNQVFNTCKEKAGERTKPYFLQRFFVSCCTLRKYIFLELTTREHYVGIMAGSNESAEVTDCIENHLPVKLH